MFHFVDKLNLSIYVLSFSVLSAGSYNSLFWNTYFWTVIVANPKKTGVFVYG